MIARTAPVERDAPSRSRRGVAPSRRVAAAAMAVSLVLFLLARAVVWAARYGDLRIYQLEGSAIRHGWDLYGTLPGGTGPATYPPFAAVVFAATTPLPFAALAVVNVALTVAALIWVGVASCRLVGFRADRATSAGLLVAACCLWCEPVATTLMYGQINLYLLALVMWDFTRRDDHPLRGLGTGIATGLKVTPAIVIVYLLLTRRLRFARNAGLTFGATVAISAVVDGPATLAYWTRDLFDTRRVGHVEDVVNQSVRGWLTRIAHAAGPGALITAAMLVVAGCGLAVAASAYRRRGDAWGLAACGVTGLLVSPISWTHHWVWCVPVAVLLCVESRVWCAAAVLVFWSFVPWRLPHAPAAALHLSPPAVVVSGWYVLFGLAFLGLAARRARARPVLTAAG